MKNDPQNKQSSASIDQNIAFFCENIESYNKGIQNLDTYVTLRSYINDAVKGIPTLLDIGNGGVFDYDINLIPKVVGLDLFLDKLPASFSCPPNVILKTGSALDIPAELTNFDGVMMVMLIHHLIGNSVRDSIVNVERSISEAFRVLKPGGKIIIVESCVPGWFYQFQKLIFPLSVRLIDKIFKHPATLQYPKRMLKAMLMKQFGKVDVIDVPLGSWVMIFGIKVPAILTPVKPTILIAEKT